MDIAPSVPAPRDRPIVIVEDVPRIRHDLDVLSAQILTLLQNPLMRKHASPKLHPIVVSLEITNILNKLVWKAPVERVLNPRSETSCSARVLPA